METIIPNINKAFYDTNQKVNEVIQEVDRKFEIVSNMWNDLYLKKFPAIEERMYHLNDVAIRLERIEGFLSKCGFIAERNYDFHEYILQRPSNINDCGNFQHQGADPVINQVQGHQNVANNQQQNAPNNQQNLFSQQQDQPLFLENSFDNSNPNLAGNICKNQKIKKTIV